MAEEEVKKILGVAYQDKRFKAAITAVITTVINFIVSVAAVKVGVPPDVAMAAAENLGFAINMVIGVYITGQTLSDIKEANKNTTTTTTTTDTKEEVKP